jgi:predicted nucleotidyltransferase component of viral defense system
MFERALPEKTKAVLIRLSPIITSEGFYLGGGTGLALQIGHRLSEDLDFFNKSTFKPEALLSLINKGAESAEVIMIERDTLITIIDDVRLSFFRYEIPLLYEPIGYEGLKVADWRDITAEKFKTVAQRGSKKDFYDLYLAMQYKGISIEDSLAFLKKRFENTGLNFYHVLRSLTYFEDADNEPEPILFDKQAASWDKVKSFFITNVKEFEKALYIGVLSVSFCL